MVIKKPDIKADIKPAQDRGESIGLMEPLLDPYEKYDMTFNGAEPYRVPFGIAWKIRGPGQRLGAIAD
jgi:hypothetical protein